MPRTYHTTRTTVVETIPPLPPVRKGRRTPAEASPTAFRIGDRLMLLIELVAPTTPGRDDEWNVKPIGSAEMPISLTIEELRLGMRIPR